MAAATLLSAPTYVLAQTRSPNRRARPHPTAKPENAKPEKKKSSLPQDKKLLSLYVAFVKEAEKLAQEYEREKKFDKARAVYEEILKVVPDYKKAKDKIEQFNKKDANADRKVLDILATKGWQDTGIQVIAGRPIRIESTGTWTFKMSHTLSPSGMVIPKDLSDFNLGSLIGIIEPNKMARSSTHRTPRKRGTKKPIEPKPFSVGKSTSFIAKTSGRLYMRMYDSDPSDNIGKLRVQISGTFERK